MSIELNEAQRQAADLLVGELQETDYRKVIFLTGFAGCGRKTTVDAVAEDIGRLYGEVVTPTFLLDNRNRTRIKENEGHYVVLVNPKESFKVNIGIGRALPDYERVEVVLKGMTFPETLAYVHQLRAETGPSLTWSDKLVADKSEGLYTLVEKMLQRPTDLLMIDYSVYTHFRDQLPNHVLSYQKFMEVVPQYLGMGINNWVDGYAKQYLSGGKQEEYLPWSSFGYRQMQIR